MSLDHRSVVFHASIALDRRHRQPAQKAHDGDDESHSGSLPLIEWRRPPQQRAERGGAQDSADEPLPGLVWTDHRRDLVTPGELAPDVLQHVAHLHDDDEKKKQPRILALEAVDFEHQQRRHVADAIHADHQAPLNLRAAFQERGRITGDGNSRRDEEKRVDRNQNGEESIPPRGHEVVLQRCDDEENPEESAVIRGAGGREGDEFAQREK